MRGTINSAETARQDAAGERMRQLPLTNLDPGHPELFRTNTHWPYFDRLRKEDPVHFTSDSMYGPYWSVTKYNDIMEIETSHDVFSSAAALGGVMIEDMPAEFRRENFLMM